MVIRLLKLLIGLACAGGLLGLDAVASATSSSGYPPPPQCLYNRDNAPTESHQGLGDASGCVGYVATATFRVMACSEGMCVALGLTGTGFVAGSAIGYRVPFTVIGQGGAAPATAFGTFSVESPDGSFALDTGQFPCQPGARVVLDAARGYLTDLATGEGAHLSGGSVTC